jgi:hypothetical protein
MHFAKGALMPQVPTVRVDVFAVGWIVLDHKGINMKIVHDTRRGAIVNWLFVEKHAPVFRDTTDDEIELMWAMSANGAQVCRVKVSPLD